MIDESPRWPCGHKRSGNRSKCRACTNKARYENDPEYREKVKDRSRRFHHQQKRVLTPAQIDRRRKRSNAHYTKNPRIYQSRTLYYKFGITLDDYEEMFRSQRGVCAICGLEEKRINTRMSVDHDHATGKVRALLCSQCNGGLGFFNDQPERLRAAADYIEHWRAEGGSQSEV